LEKVRRKELFRRQKGKDGGETLSRPTEPITWQRKPINRRKMFGRTGMLIGKKKPGCHPGFRRLPAETTRPSRF